MARTTKPNQTSSDSLTLSEAISFHQQQVSAMHQLWAFYTATVLGSLAFATSSEPDMVDALVFLAAYWAFALGELALMVQVLRLTQVLRDDLRKTVGEMPQDHQQFAATLDHIAVTGRRNPPWIAVVIQMIGNLCVTAVMIMRSLGPI